MIRKNGEPPVVEVINAKSSSPFLITCEHAGFLIPSSLGTLGLTDEQLATDVVWDVGAGDVTRELCQILGACGILNGYSRLVIDCNRTPGEPMSIPETSQRGFRVPGNSNLSEAQKREREDEFFWPYQNKIHEHVGAHIQHHGNAPIMVSVHSFAPEYHGIPRPWHIGVMWNRDKRISGPLIEFLAEDNSILVGDNEPYTAQDEIGFGYAIHNHAEIKNYPHTMLEIRADEIDTRQKARIWAERIAAALEKVRIAVSL